MPTELGVSKKERSLGDSRGVLTIMPVVFFRLYLNPKLTTQQLEPRSKQHYFQSVESGVEIILPGLGLGFGIFTLAVRIYGVHISTDIRIHVRFH